MTTSTMGGRALSIAVGLAASGGALYLLLAETLKSGHWTTDQVMMPIIVAITIGTGHLTAEAAKQRKPGSAVGFALAFVLGTVIMILNGVGRQAEGQETRIAVAEQINGKIASNAADLDAAERSRWQITAKKKEQCAGAPEPLPPTGWPVCRRLTGELAAIEERIAKLERDAKSLGAPVPVNAKAERVAEFAELAGKDHDWTKKMVTLFEPVTLPLLLEWVALVAFGYRPRRHPIATNGDAPSPNGPGPKSPVDLPNGSGSPRAVLKPKRSDRKDEVLAALLTANALGQSFGSQREATERFDVPASTFSEWMKKWEAEGLIPKRRMIGRCKVLS